MTLVKIFGLLLFHTGCNEFILCRPGDVVKQRYWQNPMSEPKEFKNMQIRSSWVWGAKRTECFLEDINISANTSPRVSTWLLSIFIDKFTKSFRRYLRYHPSTASVLPQYYHSTNIILSCLQTCHSAEGKLASLNGRSFSRTIGY